MIYPNLELFIETPFGAHFDEHQHGSRKPTKTFVIDF